MADTGVLEHWESRGGGVLLLRRPDGTTKVVQAGPRPDLPDQGEVRVYSDGRMVSKLYGTAAGEGRLKLRLITGPAVEPAETVILEAAGEHGIGGRLLLTDAGNQGSSAEVGIDGSGPYLLLKQGDAWLRITVHGMQRGGGGIYAPPAAEEVR